MATREQLLEVLSEYEAASPSDLERVVHLHEEQGGSLAELLLRESLVDEEDLFFLLSRRLAVPAIPAERLRYLTLSPEIRRRVPRNIARECVLVPVDLDMVHGRLSVAMFDPTDQNALDKLRRVSRVTEIRAYLARRSAILGALDSVYSDADDALALEDRDELPLLGTGVPAEGDAAQTAAHEDSAAKVEIDPSLALEIQAINGAVYPPPEGDEPPPRRPTPPPRRPTPPPRRPTPPPIPDEEELQRPRPEEVEVRVHGRQVQGRSLLRDEPPGPDGADALAEEDQTQPFMLLPDEPGQPKGSDWSAEEDDSNEPTGETELLPTSTVDEPLEHEITQIRVHRELVDPLAPTTAATATGQVEQLELLRELLASVGVLVSMLEERIDPSDTTYKEYGRLSRLAARELGLDELTVSRVSLAAHLYGLDMALKREVGTFSPMSVAEVFGEDVGVPGGLGPSLRDLGARALGLPAQDGTEEPLGVRLIRLVADYLELRAESDASDLDTVVQLLRTSSNEPSLVDALGQAVAALETPRIHLEGERSGLDSE